MDPGEMPTFVHRKSCTYMFIGALFVQPQTKKYPHIHPRVNGYTNGGIRILNGILFRKKKKLTTDACEDMNEYYVE